MKNLSFLITSIFLSLFSFCAYAANWQIVPAQSKIEFKAMQNSSLISGSFKKFSGKINFDPNNLDKNAANIEIDLNSLEVSLNDARDTLKTSAWLNIAKFPKAYFTANKFLKVGEKKYTANGKLTLKGKTLPLNVDFTLEEYNAKNARATGSATLKRADFDVGPALAENAHGVKDAVEIYFVINAVK